MKCITIFYNVATEEEVMAIIEAAHVGEYTKIPRCQGKGAITGPRLDDHIWPGFNVTLVLVVEDAVAPVLMAALQTFRNGPMGRRTGIFAYQTAVEAVLAPPPDVHKP